MHNQSGISQVLEVNLSGIPEELKAWPHWVCWKLQWQDGKGKKVPVDPKTGKFASSTNPSTWSTFDQAWKYYEGHRGAGIMGIGFVFSKDDPYTGVDLDHCRNAETGDILPWALEIVQYLNSYTELSPSGTGLHILVRGILPVGSRKVGDVEMYDDGHYFTITGVLLWLWVSQAIESRQNELQVLHARFLGGGHDASGLIQPDVGGRRWKAGTDSKGWEALLQQLGSATLTPADLDIIQQFKGGQYGEMYRLLFMGDWEGAGRLRKQGVYKSNSDADQALLNRLAQLTNGSPRRIYAIFKDSKLAMRDKILENRTYLARTIKKAIEGMVWQPAQASTGGEGPPVMSSINHEAGLAELNTDQLAGGLRPVHSPRPSGGVHSLTHCGPSLEDQEEEGNPQVIPGSGPQGGLGDEGSFGGALIKSYLYKGDDISPSISPSTEVSASVKTQKTSMAARVREIASVASGTFTVDEIASAVVKSSSISPHPASPEEWQPWRKQVSNELGRLCKQGVLVREKNGTYRRTLPETDQVAVVYESSTLETYQVDAKGQMASWLSIREANRMRPPETPGEPLDIHWPLDIGQEFRVFPKDLVVAGAVTNSCKTTLAVTLARMNMNIHQITYINSEMSNEELAGKLQDFERAYGIPLKTFYHKVYFAYCGCNALDKSDMNRLTALLDPDGINIIDYIKINDKFFMIGDCLEKIHARLNRGIAVIFFQKDPDAPHLLGKSFPEHLARVVMMIDIDQKTGLRCLQFTKVKFPARKGDRPETRKIWFSVKDGVSLDRTEKPAKGKNQKEDKVPSDQGFQCPDQPLQPQAGISCVEIVPDLIQRH